MRRMDRREPSRGSAWKRARSPSPMPMMPLRRKNGNAAPVRPFPKPKAQMASKAQAHRSRQKLASVPPSSLAERWPQTTDAENKMVVRKAGSTRQVKMGERRGRAWTRRARRIPLRLGVIDYL